MSLGACGPIIAGALGRIFSFFALRKEAVARGLWVLASYTWWDMDLKSSFSSVEICGKEDSGSEGTQWGGVKVIKFHFIKVLNKLYFAPFFLTW